MLVVKKMFLMCALVLTLGLAVGCNKDTNGDDVNNAVTVQADLSDVQVDVGEYKNMAVEVTKIADITDEDVEQQLQALVDSTASEVLVTDRAIAEGDLVSISYQCYLNNKAYGETEENYYVTIGSGVFFDGAEMQLVGTTGGNVVDIEVTLPQSYPNAELAGKTVSYQVTVNGIIEESQGELTDEYIAAVSDCSTVDEYRQQLKAQLEEALEDQRQTAKRTAIWQKLLSQAQIGEVPQDIIDERIGEYKSYDEEGAELESIDLETYVSLYYGMSVEDYETEIESMVMEEIKTELIVNKIAALEGLDADEVTATEIEDYAKEMGYDDVEEFKQQMDMDTIKQSILLEKVTDLLMASAVVTEVE